ncbi:MAG: hypothetical protein ACHQIG_03675 [Acidimicrobiia bacterium]
MRPTMKRLLGMGVLAAAGYAVWRAIDARGSDSNVTWEPQPFPYPPVPRTTEVAEDSATAATQGGDARDDEAPTPGGWVEPDDATCPATHPVKAKLSSGIFHLPGGANYDRTRPDRCYASSAAAEADGLRAAKA